jgi:hypothetical protein
MGLAEPTLMALTRRPVTRTLNPVSSKVGKVTFDEGMFLMIDGERAPTEAIKFGKSFVAISHGGVPCAKRVDKPVDGVATPTSKPTPKPQAPANPKDASVPPNNEKSEAEKMVKKLEQGLRESANNPKPVLNKPWWKFW